MAVANAATQVPMMLARWHRERKAPQGCDLMEEVQVGPFAGVRRGQSTEDGVIKLSTLRFGQCLEAGWQE